MKNAVANQISAVDIALFLLTALILNHMSAATPTFERCQEAARLLNKTCTITFSGFSGEDTNITTGEISAAPRVGAHVAAIHARARRSIYPLRAAYPTVTTNEVRNLSLCPWTLTTDSNNTRIPNQLYKAECHHDNGNNQCNLDIPGLPARGPQVNHFMGMLMNKIECNVVYTSVEVAYESCVEEVYTLRKEWEEWPVACTCSRRKIRVGQALPMIGRK